jgi:PncC family amidohydrolase
MNVSQSVVEYLRQHDLRLTTAESCTAGKIVTLLAEVPNSGDLIESGYVVYSCEAKQRLLNVSPDTIKTFNLTSCEVACEMALGALRDSPANVAVATTGILGPEDIDGIPAGTVCFAWAYQTEQGKRVFTQQHRFFGSRSKVQLLAAEHALKRISFFHKRALACDKTGEQDRVNQ